MREAAALATPRIDAGIRDETPERGAPAAPALGGIPIGERDGRTAAVAAEEDGRADDAAAAADDDDDDDDDADEKEDDDIGNDDAPRP